ncbi:MAG TPA: LPS assembly protein LptD [Thermoanaerobaculia bacterium]|nr:LPS assembly protein LptD [Thermoanaerobaculia bacterium]
MARLMLKARRLASGFVLGLCLALPAPPGSAEQPPPQTPQTPPAAQPAPPAATPPEAATQGTLGPSPAMPPPAATPATPATPPGQGLAASPAPAAGKKAAPAGPAAKPAAPGPAAPAAPEQPPGAGPDRINFELKFPEDQGGGSAAGSAATLEYKREDYAVLAGKVRIRYQDLEMQADRAEIDLKTKQVSAQGNVILDQGPKRMTGNTLNFDLNTKTGKLLEATAFVAPDYYFSGVEIDKTGEDTYTVIDGLFTSCAQKVPDWSFHLGRAEVQVEGYAHIHHARLQAKKLPLFYTPYLLWPVKRDRASGFLVPAVRYSQRRGASIGLAYFQTLGQSYDTTFHLDPYFRGYLGVGDEFRYHPTEGTLGDIGGYLVKDPTRGNLTRWKVEARHDTEDLPWGMRGVLHYLSYSDFNFSRDFERDFDRSSLRIIDSRGFVTGNWGPHLFNFLVDDRRVLVNTGTDFITSVDQRKLPELQYQLRSTKLGPTPLYLQVTSSGDFLEVNRPDSYSGNYGRFDLFPQLTLPIRTVPWLSLSVTGGERMTWYAKSLDSATGQLTGGSLSRFFPFGSAEVVGPSVSRIFDLGLADFVKFKHVIEPRITYTYLGPFNQFQNVPLFDEVDAITSTNAVRVALDNRVLGKPGGENASAREVLLLEFATSYSFDKTQPLQTSFDQTRSTSRGPIEALLRINPTQKISLKADAAYSTLFNRLASTSFSGNVGFAAADFVGLTWFVNYIPDTGMTLGNQLRLNTLIDVLPQMLQVQAQVNYDVANHLLQQQFYAINYTAQCYGLRLELRDFRALVGPRLHDRDIRLSLSLKNIGTLIDYNSRSVTYAP